MKLLRLIHARWRGLSRKAELEQELDEELRFHIAMRTEEKIARGMAPAAAAAEAQRELGNINLIKDACRDVSGGGAIEVLWQDIRFAARVLMRDRGFTAVAVVGLALGIGANTALFTVMSSVLLRPLAYPDSERIMTVWSAESSRADRGMRVSYPDFEDMAARNQSFETLGAYRASSFAVTGLGDTAVNVRGAYVHPNTFALLGVKPVIGRLFRRSENEPGSRVAIVSYRLWKEHFGGALSSNKPTVSLDGEAYSIVGVMPEDFRFPAGAEQAELWTSFATDREPYPSGAPPFTLRRDAHSVYLLGRLKADVTPAAAHAEMNRIAADLAVEYPETNARVNSAIVIPWLTHLTQRVRPTLLLLAAAGLCVLAVTCVNIANLLLARGTARQNEIAIRATLGAGPRRILRQLLTESLLLAVIGGFVGLLLALCGTRYVASLLPDDFPRAAEIAPHPGVLAFAVVATLVTTCLFGFAPAWRSARCDPAPILNAGSKGMTESRQGRRTRRLLVVSQMVLAFVLLVGACCLIRGVWRLQNADLGFNPRGLVSADASIVNKSESDGRIYAQVFYRNYLAQLQSMPAVKWASGVFPASAPGPQPVTDFEINGRPLAKADLPRAEAHIVMPNYFATMEIPIKQGRDFRDADDGAATPVAIINETLARTHFPNENPLGKRITPGVSVAGTLIEREIIAVVGDVRPNSLLAERRAEIYVPHAQCSTYQLSLVLRSEGAGESVVSELMEQLAAIEQLPLSDIGTVEDKLDAAIAQPRLSSALLSLFAFIAVVLTAIGVYGVASYSAAQRRHEIGIRLAFGAQRLAVVRLVVADGLRLIGLAVVGGGICSVATVPLLTRFTQGTVTADAGIIVLVALLISAVAFVACWLPARRAAGLDPLVALGQR